MTMAASMRKTKAVVDTSRPDGEVPQVVFGINGVNINGHDLNRHDVDNCYNDLGSIPRIVVAQNGNKGAAGVVPQSLEVVSPINELILNQFTNNYHLIAQKQSNIEVGLVIRVLLLKNKEVINHYSFKIISTDNVHNATLAVANVMCKLYLAITTKGDTLTCSLGTGYNGVGTSITRNVHISKLITILNKIKVKTGLYTNSHKMELV